MHFYHLILSLYYLTSVIGVKSICAAKWLFEFASECRIEDWVVNIEHLLFQWQLSLEIKDIGFGVVLCWGLLFFPFQFVCWVDFLSTLTVYIFFLTKFLFYLKNNVKTITKFFPVCCVLRVVELWYIRNAWHNLQWVSLVHSYHLHNRTIFKLGDWILKY